MSRRILDSIMLLPKSLPVCLSVQSLTSLGPRPSMAATGQRTMSNSTNESKVRTRISGEIVERQFSSADCATPDLFNSSGADAHVIVTVSVIAPMQFFFTCSKEKTKHCRGGGEGRFRKLLQNSFAALRFKFRSNRGKQRITSAPHNPCSFADFSRRFPRWLCTPVHLLTFHPVSPSRA